MKREKEVSSIVVQTSSITRQIGVSRKKGGLLENLKKSDAFYALSVALDLLQLKKSNWFAISIFFFVLVGGVESSYAITNGVTSNIDAVVFMEDDGACSASVVGTNPLTVLSVAHCVGFLPYSEGEIKVSTWDKKLSAKNPKIVLPKTLTENPDYKEYLALEEELKEIPKYQENSLGEQHHHSIHSHFRLFFSGPPPSPEWMEARERVKDKYNEIKELRYANDLMLLVFEGVDWYPNMSKENLLNSQKILAIDSRVQEENTPILLVGYGNTSPNEFTSTSGIQYQTTNYLNEYGSNEEVPNGYPVYGNAYPFVENQITGEYTDGKNGSILKGDSGGPVIGARGIVALNNFNFSEFDNQEYTSAPREDWPVKSDNGLALYTVTGHVATGSEEFASLLEAGQEAGADVTLAEDTQLNELILTSVH